MAQEDGMGEVMKLRGTSDYKYPWDIRPPLPELTPDEQDNLDTQPITPLPDDETALDADINDFIQFNARLESMKGNDDGKQL
jgi:hypothetical protein